MVYNIYDAELNQWIISQGYDLSEITLQENLDLMDRFNLMNKMDENYG